MLFENYHIEWQLLYVLLPKTNPRKLGTPNRKGETWHKYYFNSLHTKAEEILGILKRISMARKIDLLANARLYYCTSDLFMTIFVPTHGQCKREQFGTCADILPSVNVSCDFMM
jgi:hypothetical protein